jgi:enamine deaminase RidA (YjgF/YER057c/UK114 family)
MRLRVFLILFAFAIVLTAAKKKDDADVKTQQLREPQDLPAVATGDATRLVFHVSPLSGKGLLSQQTREALAAILKANNGATIVHLRAFVAGNGDLRRVSQIVSEVLVKRHAPLPSLSVIQVGALPIEGAQIVLESISEAKKAVNPSGISFVTSADRIGSGALAVTCFVSDISKASELAGKFGGAVVNVVQTQRLPPRPVMECEAVVRGGHAGHYVFTGTQGAFGFEAKDATLAFQRVGRELGGDAVLTNIYALTKPIADMAMKSRIAKGEVAAFQVEGVASSDASFAVDVVAAKQ